MTRWPLLFPNPKVEDWCEMHVVYCSDRPQSMVFCSTNKVFREAIRSSAATEQLLRPRRQCRHVLPGLIVLGLQRCPGLPTYQPFG